MAHYAKKCPECGRGFYALAHYCPQDGSRLADVPDFHCPNCLRFVEKGDKFCGYCGKALPADLKPTTPQSGTAP